MPLRLWGEHILKKFSKNSFFEMNQWSSDWVKRWCLSLIFLGVCVGIPACTKTSESQQAASKKEGERSSREKGGAGKGGRGRSRGPALVQTIAVKKVSAAQKAESSVPLVGRKQTNVFSKVSGRVTRILVPEGRAVTAGQTLFQVDRSDPGESYLSVPVTSPISGWVGRWNVTEGTQVSTQDPVVLVVDDQTLIANIFLPVQEWVQVKLNSKVLIRVQDVQRPARILTIARAAESGSGRGALTVELNNSDHAFKSGVVALASLELDTRERLLLPVAALRISDQGAAVFRVEDNKAKRVKVDYTLFNNDTVEILSGLAENDVVVSVGAHQLFDGAEVRISDPTAQASPSAPSDGAARQEKRPRGEGVGQ